LNQYDNTNVDEWSAASGLLERQGNYDKLIDNTIQTYNPGVKPADWVLTISTQDSCGCLITLGEKDSANGIEIYWGD
jgi:hypothetical protein